jgi:hypothetical protein
MRTFGAALFGLALAAPLAAQDAPTVSIRPFVMVSEQQFAASNTFNAVLGQSQQLFWGGGVSVTQDDRYYLDVTASQFKKTGQRAFRSSTGDVFRLGIPLRTTEMPIEITGGYRFHNWPHFVPYAGGGIGFYKYTEQSDFSDPSENIDTRHAGAILEGGVEVRLHRWLGAGVDVHYTYIPGILGTAGISKDTNEKSLGGVSARFKIIVGR